VLLCIDGHVDVYLDVRSTVNRRLTVKPVPERTTTT